MVRVTGKGKVKGEGKGRGYKYKGKENDKSKCIGCKNAWVHFTLIFSPESV